LTADLDSLTFKTPTN